jgi:hypothetical protein
MCFYIPEIPEFRLHRVISDYYTKMNINEMIYNEFRYVIN